MGPSSWPTAFKKVLKVIHITHYLMKAYLSRTNGQVETFNRLMKEILRSYVDEQSKD